MSKSPVYIGAGSNELAVQSALNLIEDGIDSASHLLTIADWVSLTDGTTVIDRATGDTGFYSAKEYAHGSTLAAGGSSKNWAQLATTPTNTAEDASAKEWATGTSTHKLDASAKEYATHEQYQTVDGSSEYSAKHYSAQSQDWAAKTTIVRNDADGADVDYSSKQYAVGTPPDGSAKEWATTDTNAIAGGLFSAKQYAANSAASASSAATDLATFQSIFHGASTSTPSSNVSDGDLWFDTNTGVNVMKVYDLGNTTWVRTTPTTANQTQINTLTTGKDGTTSTSGTNLNIVQVDVVADNIGSVNTVATDIVKVVKVADDLLEAVSEIDTVAADLLETTSEIDTVAVNIVNVNLVGDDIGNVNDVAGKLTEIDRLSTVAAIADMALLGLEPVITDMDLLGAAGVIGDIETVADNIDDVSSFADLYQINDFDPVPTTDGSGVNALVAGDLAFDTTAGQGLKVYNGSAWTGTINTTDGVIVKQEYTANGTVKHYALAHDQDMEIVYLNGVKLLAGDGSNNNDYFSVSGGSSTTYVGDGNVSTHIYFHTAPINTFVISVVAWGASNNTLAISKSGGTYSGVVTLPSPVLNIGVSGSAIKDEDNMSSNSDTHIATQQSIKAYVDSQTHEAGDITSVVAGTGLSGGGTTGAVTLNVAGDLTLTTPDLGTPSAGVMTNMTGAVSASINDDQIDSQHYAAGSIDEEHIADDAVTEDKLANTLLAEIDANTAKVTNVTTNLGITGDTAARVITSSDGSGATIPVATTTVSGVMSTAIFDAVALNTAKTGISSGQASAITANTAKTGITSGQASAITANTAKVTNYNQTQSDINALAITSVGTLTALTGGTGDFKWSNTGGGATLFADYSANKVGIGIDDPDAKLEIYGSASGLEPESHLKLRAQTSDGDYLGILFSAYSGSTGKGWFGFERRPSSGSGGGDFVFLLDSAANNDDIATTDQVMRIANNGVVTIAAGTVTSDERLKENITTITGGLEKINALTGRTFTWKEESNFLTGTQYGLIAQEVESIIPGLVYNKSGIKKLDKDGNIKKDNEDVLETDEYAKSLSMEGFIPVLIEAVKELSAKVKALEAA